MADTLANLVVKLEAQTAQYDESLQRANKQLGKFRRNQKTQLEQISDGFKTLATGVAAGAAAAAAGFGVMYAKQSEVIIQLGQMSDRLAISTEDLQAFQYAGQQVGISAEQVTDGLQDMVERIGDAAVGGGEAVEVFEQLGISVAQLYRLDTAEQFALLSDEINNMGTAADRTAAKFKVFGEAAESGFIELVNSDAIAKARADIEAFGIAVSRIDVAKVERARTQFERLSLLLQGFQQRMTIVAAPYVEELIRQFTNLAAKMGGMDKLIMRVFDTMITGAGKAIDFLVELEIKTLRWEKAKNVAAGSANVATFGLAGNMDEIAARGAELDAEIRNLIDTQEGVAGWADRFREAMAGSADAAEDAAGRINTARESQSRAVFYDQSADDAQEAREKALNSILEYLQSEEEAIAESYFNRRQIVLENTELTELERQFLLDELRAAYEEEKAELELERAAEKAANEDSIRATNLAKEQAYWDQFNKIAGVAQNKHFKMFETWKRSEDASWLKHTQFAAGVISSLTSHFGKESGAMFEISKAASIAMAIVNTAQGVTAALSLGVPGIPMAALIAAAGAVEIATIASTSPSGGGGGSSFSGGGAGGISPGTPAEIETPDLEPERSVQDVNIVVEPGIYDSNSVRDLIVAINEELSDGIDLNVRVG